MERDDKKRSDNIENVDEDLLSGKPPALMLFDLQTEPEKLEQSESIMHRWTSLSGEEPAESTNILNPHHPLLARFQQTLKTHLTRQIEKINTEMLELETSIKEEDKQRESLGVVVYDKQQDICRQQIKLETLEKDVQDLVAKREKQEADVINLRKKHQEEYYKLLKTEEQERSLRNEVESLTSLERQLTEWKEEMDSELTVNKRISDKTMRDKKQLAEEKRQLDMLIYNLMSDVWKSEREIEHLDRQLRVQEVKRDELHYASQDANSNLDAIHSQQNSLLKAWNSVLLSLMHRDTQHEEASETVKNLTEQLRNQTSEIEGYKRSIEKEMKESLQINERKLRIESDYSTTTKQQKVEEDKLYQLTQELADLRLCLEITEKDFQSVNNVNQNRQSELNQIVKEMEKQTSTKVDYEDQVMKYLDDCETNDKAANYLTKLVRQLKEKCRELELSMLNAENADAKLLLEIEHQKGANNANAEYINSLQKLHNERDATVKKLNAELYYLKNTAILRQRQIDALNTKLNNLIADNEGVELSPQEIQIRDMEKTIEELIDTIHTLELNWMREQNTVVSLTEQRNEQVHQLNLLSKQIMIINQKNLQLEDELDKHKRREMEMSRNVDRLLQRLEKLNLEISRHRSINEKEDCQLSMTQNKFLDQLQDAEKECAQLETDITDLEAQKVSLAKQLIEVNREGLMWQKQAQMATEARKAVEEDRSSGESNQMKIEIHRMQVRYNQLRRMQERMIVDLEQCVFRREDIICKSEAKAKREKGGMSQTRLLFVRKINDMKTKIKQTKKELNETQIHISNGEEQTNLIKEQVNQGYDDAEKIRETITDLEKKFVEAELNKHSNLDRLIKKQRKARAYDEMLRGIFKPRPTQILDIELMKQKELHTNLHEIVKQLLYDFPQHTIYIKKMLITLGTFQHSSDP